VRKLSRRVLELALSKTDWGKALPVGHFHSYRIMRVNEAQAKVRGRIVDSDAPPSGIGEPPMPVIAPALAAALHAATGTWFRKLPLMADWKALEKARSGRGRYAPTL